MPAQLVERAQAHVLHPHLGQARQVFLEIFDLLLELQEEEAEQAGAVRLARFFRGVENAQRHAVAVVGEAGVAEHGLPPATVSDLDLHQLSQLAASPVGHATVLGRGLVQFGEFLPRLPAPFGAQVGEVAPLAELAPVLVDEQEIEMEVGRQRVGAEGVGRDLPAARIEPARVQDEVHQRRDQRLIGVHLAGGDRGAEFGGELRHRHEFGTDLLRQRFDELDDLFLEQAGNQPFAARGRQLVELGQRHGQRHAVLGRAGLEMVGEREIDAGELDAVREGLGRHPRRLVAHQVFALQVEQFGLLALGLLAPFVEIDAADHVFGNQPVVEGDDQLVVDQHVRAARLVLERLDVEDQLVVVVVETPATGVVLGDLAADEALADEQLARLLRIHRAVIHALLGIDDDAVERRALEGHGLHRFLFPVRVEVTALDEMRADLFEPLGLDARHAAREKLGRLGDFGGGDPLAGFFDQRRAGMDEKLDPARAEVVPRVLGLAADIAQ